MSDNRIIAIVPRSFGKALAIFPAEGEALIMLPLLPVCAINLRSDSIISCNNNYVEMIQRLCIIF
jgi:hypothetical protein